MENQEFLEKGKILKVMMKYAIPCIISLLVGALYNIVDQIFIANASYLGSNGNAANTVVFPLTVIALAFALLVGDGCCAFVSIALGKKDDKSASNSIGLSIVIILGISLLLTLIYAVFCNQLITLFGGKVNEETYALSKEYFTFIIIGIPFYMFGQGVNPIIRADGSPKFAMLTTLFGALVNIILDPLFIFVFKWGMMGAAIATVLGQVVTCALSIYYLCHMKIIKINKDSFKLDMKITGRTLSLGICSFLAQVSLVIAMATINNMIKKYSALDEIFMQEQYAQIPMAVVGIVMKFFQIVISIVIGLAASCIPIVGYNIGAKNYSRVKKLLTVLIIAEAIVGVVSLLIVELLPGQLITIFGAKNESVYYKEFAIKAFRIYLCMIVLACINKATFIFLQAMGKALSSTFLSMIREVVFGVGFAIVLPIFFGLDGVLYSMPVSDVLTAIVSLIIIIHTYRSLTKLENQKENQIVQSNA